jgi:hypothetical protein
MYGAAQELDLEPPKKPNMDGGFKRQKFFYFFFWRHEMRELCENTGVFVIWILSDVSDGSGASRSCRFRSPPALPRQSQFWSRPPAHCHLPGTRGQAVPAPARTRAHFWVYRDGNWKRSGEGGRRGWFYGELEGFCKAGWKPDAGRDYPPIAQAPAKAKIRRSEMMYVSSGPGRRLLNQNMPLFSSDPFLARFSADPQILKLRRSDIATAT